MTVYRVASVGPFNLGKGFEIIVEHVHLLHQARESRFSRLSDLLIHSFRLGTENHKQETREKKRKRWIRRSN